MKSLNEEFEKALAEYTGAKGVIAVDSCTHALELALRFSTPTMYATIPAHTHFSIPMTLKKLEIEYMFTEDKWENEYRIQGSTVYDSSQFLGKDMFQTENPNQTKIICVSFGPGSALEIGYGGAILTNDRKAYDWIQGVVADGRDLDIQYWEDQKKFRVGYGYRMRAADAVIGLKKLTNGEITNTNGVGSGSYPDLRDFVINK